MLIVAMDSKTQSKAKKIFSFKGSIKIASEVTGVDRTTIPRIVNNGRGDERTVKAITEYIKSMKVA